MRSASFAPRERMAAMAVPLLNFLAADPERFERFLTLTGIDVGGLRAASRSSGFGSSLFGYLAGDEPLIVAFAQEQGLDPAEVGALAAAAVEPPEDDPHRR